MRRLIEAGRLEEALSVYHRLELNDVDGLRTQGTLLLMLKRYREAMGIYERLDGALLKQKIAGQRALMELAVAQWLAGDRMLAVETAAKDVAELRN